MKSSSGSVKTSITKTTKEPKEESTLPYDLKFSTYNVKYADSGLMYNYAENKGTTTYLASNLMQKGGDIIENNSKS